MEYCAKCQKCEYLKTVLCYDIPKGHRINDYCRIHFAKTRRKYVANLPPGRVTGSGNPPGGNHG